MQDLPKSIDPDTEQQLFEKLAHEREDLKDLEYIRRHMRLIYKQEQKDVKEKSGSQ